MLQQSKKSFQSNKQFSGQTGKRDGFSYSHDSKQNLTNQFKNFFIDKIDTIVNAFDSNFSTSYENADLPINPIFKFSPITSEDALSLIRNMNRTFCQNDPFDIKKLALMILKLSHYIMLILPSYHFIVVSSLTLKNMPI